MASPAGMIRRLADENRQRARAERERLAAMSAAQLLEYRREQRTEKLAVLVALGVGLLVAGAGMTLVIDSGTVLSPHLEDAARTPADQPTSVAWAFSLLLTAGMAVAMILGAAVGRITYNLVRAVQHRRAFDTEGVTA